MAWKDAGHSRNLIAFHLKDEERERWLELFSDSKYETRTKWAKDDHENMLSVVLGRIGTGVSNDRHLAMGNIIQYDMWVQMRGRKAWALSSQPQTQFDNRLVSESLGDGVCYAGLLSAPYVCALQPGELLVIPPGWYHSTCHLDETTASIRYRKLMQCPTIGICADPEARMRREEAGE